MVTVSAPELARGRTTLIEGVPEAALAYYIATRFGDRPLLCVTSTLEAAEKLADELAAYGVGDVVLFPAEEHVPFEEVSPDPRLVAQRLVVRHRALAGERPRIIVAPAHALLGRVMPAADFTRASELYVRGQSVDREALLRGLVRSGFQRAGLCEDAGTFAVRGGVVDVFPPGLFDPVRLDLFGDELAGLSHVDPQSQRTGKPLEAVAIHPIREVLFDETTAGRAQTRLRALGEVLDVPTRRISELTAEIATGNYFFGIEALWPLFYAGSDAACDALVGPDTLVVETGGDEVADALGAYWKRAHAERQRRLERHQLALAVEDHLLAPDELEARLTLLPRARLVALADSRAAGVVRPELGDFRDLTRELAARRADASRGEILDPLVAELRSLFERRQEVFLACHSRGNAERLRELLLGRKLDLPILDALPDLGALGAPRRSPRRAIVVAALAGGVVDPARGVAILTDVELLGAPPRRPRAAKAAPRGEGLTTLRDLREGDPVIHVDHGVARYLGLKRIILNGVDGDYVHLEYQGGDKLYLPVYRLNLLQRHRGPPSTVKLDKLGGTRWARAKQRVKDAVIAMAHELLRLQATRRARPGFALAPPDEHFRAFEATFPFDETPDQQRAIDEVLADLVQDTPMDRLVCGDVGFGKTEVAVRAAFLAVVAKKQVAVLVPTTVLAEQHGVTFRERLGPQGVSVEVLSRFRTPQETADLLARLRQGRVDIVVGTHRLLSPDVAFSALGLLVVDEEHRFGVKHKERIKQLRALVHVLTLTATPIPRTLHMSMTGLRDLSLIQTPPVDRTAIRTEVTRFDEELVGEAIRRELHRGGQVFVVHNRVRSIQAMAELVRRLVPEARVGMGHGQMSADELEQVMVRFVRRELDVLVSTAIIESGIDIPSANTMIVNRADTFGLAQLYQIRGRIGRGRERAYAYLLLPRSEKITREARERLGVLKRFSELGSGFSIASFDLDLRGAGDLLGAEQSGHMAAVGFELYTELLQEAVEGLRGAPHREAVEPEIKLPVPAVLPESYVPEPMQRLAYYQRLTQAASDEVIFNVCAEIQDLYGDAPAEVAHLGEVMVIRRRLLRLGAVALTADVVAGELKMGVAFAPDAPVDRADLARRLQEEPSRYRLLPSGRLAISTALPGGEVPHRELLRRVREELGALGAHDLAATR